MRSVSRVILVGIWYLLIGCDHTGTNSAESTDAFVGNWTFDSGSFSPMCSGLGLEVMDLATNGLTIAAVDSAHIAVMITTPGLACNVTFGVMGETVAVGGSTSTATAAADQTCTMTAQNVTSTISVTSWTLTLSSSKIDSLSMSMSGMVDVRSSECAPTVTGTLSRVAVDAAMPNGP